MSGAATAYADSALASMARDIATRHARAHASLGRRPRAVRYEVHVFASGLVLLVAEYTARDGQRYRASEVI